MTSERKLPSWLKVKAPGGSNFIEMKHLLRGKKLHTVCEEANCPNIGNCWERRTATFIILGDICTRNCAYCAVTHGVPGPLDPDEPTNVAQSVEYLGLRYAVITSVDRDDLHDGGASVFASCTDLIHQRTPGCKVEVLVPDFGGNWDALALVLGARPETFNHNIETVRRIFRYVRPKGNYDLSLKMLAKAKEIAPGAVTKSGLMIGLGETWDEILETMRDLRSVDCDLLTIGQYLRPSDRHVPICKWYTPEEFDDLAREGEAMGFKSVAASPLVRSSYHADEQHAAISAGG